MFTCRLDSTSPDVDEAPPEVLEGATRFTARDGGRHLTFEVPPDPDAVEWFATDLVVETDDLVRFRLEFRDGKEDPFAVTYGALAHCQARLRLPIDWFDLTEWARPREAALLRPVCRGRPVDLSEVEEICLGVDVKTDGAVVWEQTPLRATADEPPLLDDPALPRGPLVDALGQHRLREWPGKTDSRDEVVDRLRTQFRIASDSRHRERPPDRSRWGGWAAREFEATGFFDTHHDGDRWWLVDPGGHPFLSVGMRSSSPVHLTPLDGLGDALAWLPGPDEGANEVAVSYHDYVDADCVDFFAANCWRAFGDGWEVKWEVLVDALLRDHGFNTVDTPRFHDPDAPMPYLRSLDLEFPESPAIHRDFPDVFDPAFERDAVRVASPLADTREDSALLGYVLGNEPAWMFLAEPTAAGMLRTTESCAARHALVDFLRDRHGDTPLASAWDLDATYDDLRDGRSTWAFTPTARDDLVAFSQEMVDRFFEVLVGACRDVDPDHLCLGTRFGEIPPDWILAGLRHVDVLVSNWYDDRLDARFGELSRRLDVPVLAGEFHFGATDVGLQGAGLQRVPDQDARGRAYRTYVEDAVSNPWCVGAHWFQLYDQPTLGRLDGECYDIGLLDVCNRPYEPLSTAVRRSHHRLYAVADGRLDPFDDSPDVSTWHAY